MIEKITLDMLSQDSVSLKKQQYMTVNGTEYPIGLPWRRAYSNSERGRAEAQAEIAEPYLSAIMAMWGNAPTVVENFN